MRNRGAPASGNRIGIIDLGSNSLRLAIFERHGAALFPLVNEKVMCGLARGLSTSGRLNREGIELAQVNLRRFVALARAIGVDHLAVLATAAVRDATDGRAFADQVARQCNMPVEVIDGVEEARLSAAGVVAGIPDADGIVADLGGGSIELVEVGSSGADPAARIGRGVSLPLGPLRLAELGDNPRAVSDAVERSLAVTPIAAAGRGRTYTWLAVPRARSRACIWNTPPIRCTSCTPTRSGAAKPRRFSTSSAACRADRWSGSRRSRASGSKWCRSPLWCCAG